MNQQENCGAWGGPGYWVPRKNHEPQKSRRTSLDLAISDRGQLRRELVVTQAKNARLRAENERLARESEALRSNPRAVEKVARADLGWVRSGEVVFDLGRAP